MKVLVSVKGIVCRYFADADTVDPRFLTCQRHSNPDAAPRLKHACMKFHKQEEERLRIMHRRLLTQREEKKRQRGLARHKKILKSLEGVSISWPENDIKRPKLLNTSPMFLDLFRDKAICAGFTHEQFERNFKRIDGADLSYLPPGFSHEFLSYFEAREKILPTERMRLKELETEAMNLRKQQAELEKELCELEKSISASNSNTSPQPRVQSPVREQRVLLSWYSTMVALGVKKIRKPFTGLSHELCSPSKQHRASKTPSSKPSTSTVSPSTCARSKSVSNKRNGRISSGTSASNATKSNDISPISKSQPNTPILHSLHASPPVCSICHKVNVSPNNMRFVFLPTILIRNIGLQLHYSCAYLIHINQVIALSLFFERYLSTS
ncbi:unnamed protein product [Anisakis simplex]|uniref:PHD finger protein 14 (inferred by orthology to a human protein) n=1 Tax=Anisakis simplex TaxID=6269 RepID=A0A0M3J1Q5_ANISI|nr:unnamed protein product [Anisakis simplex]